MPMDEEKPKKKRKKAVATDDGAGEHKPNWRENLATMAEIKAFVSDTTDEIEANRRPLASDAEPESESLDSDHGVGDSDG